MKFIFNRQITHFVEYNEHRKMLNYESLGVDKSWDVISSKAMNEKTNKPNSHFNRMPFDMEINFIF